MAPTRRHSAGVSAALIRAALIRAALIRAALMLAGLPVLARRDDPPEPPAMLSAMGVTLG
jgi:hypothetical protein